MQLPFWRGHPRAVQQGEEPPGQSVDNELARLITEGDRSALQRWLDRHLTSLYGYVSRRLGPGREAASDTVVRATLEEALRGLKLYARGTASVPMQLWLVRIANKHIRHIARSRNVPGTANTEGLNEGNVEGEQLTRLRRVLAKLPPSRQAALSLALFEGMSAEEIAGGLGVTLPRAMRLLRSALKSVKQLESLEARSESEQKERRSGG